MGMIMHDDVPYGEGTSYTQGTGIAINNNIIAVDADNAPTENSEKPVKSKGVYSALESNSAESTSLLKSTVGWTGKNLLKITATTQTINGVTFTVNADGSITANGTASDYTAIIISTNIFKNYANIPLVCSAGNKSNSIYLRLWNRSNSTWYRFSTNLDDIYVTPSETDANKDIEYQFVMLRGATVNNIKVYPMLRDASITDDTYEPYHESVEEEIEQIYADNGVLGAKNILPYPYKDSTKTANGLTFTDNGDGTITINGTATANTTFSLDTKGTSQAGFLRKFAGKPIKICGGHSENKRIEIWATNIDYPINYASKGEAVVVTLPSSIATDSYDIRIRIQSGETCNNEIFYPQFLLPSDPDDTYVPYAMTNRELTEEKLSISELKTIASSATDFAAFKTAIANL